MVEMISGEKVWSDGEDGGKMNLGQLKKKVGFSSSMLEEPMNM